MINIYICPLMHLLILSSDVDCSVFQDRVWTNVGKSLNCIIAMVDRLLEKENIPSVAKENESDPLPAERVASPLSGKKCSFVSLIG